MIATRLIAGMTLGTGIALALTVAPALGAGDTASRAVKRPGTARSISGFTPAAADPRLAAVFARGGVDSADFRFTPSESRRSSRDVTVAVRARSTQVAQTNEKLAPASSATVGVAPIAYNLGVAVGWKRFALSGDVAKIDTASQPGGREAADVAVSYSLDRFTGRVAAVADRPSGTTPKLVEGASSYSLDLGGSYSLTRNVDLTAGVRYKSERERLARLSDDRRDSQAVYVGTAFRF